MEARNTRSYTEISSVLLYVLCDSVVKIFQIAALSDCDH